MPLTLTLRVKGLTRLLLEGGIFFLSLAALNSQAAEPATTTHDLVIGETVLTQPALSLMYGLVTRDDPGVTRETFLDTVIERHLIADHVRDNHLREAVIGNNAVGFSADVQLQNRESSTLRALFQAPLSASIQALGDAGLAGVLTRPLAPDWRAIAAVLKPGARQVYALNADEQRAAAAITLTCYRLEEASAETCLSLADIYQRQNVQGRIALHSGDKQWLLNETRLRISQAYVHWWSATRSGLSAEDLASVRTLVDDQMLYLGYLAHSGVSAEIHAGNPALSQRARQVTDTEIRQWYGKHRARFREVNAVRAWHRQCTQRAECDAAAQALAAGRPPELVFTDAASDNNAEASWIARDDDALDWLTSVALMQPLNTPGQTIRSPGGGDWHLFLVVEQRWHTHSVDSRTVDAVARREIAREQLTAEFVDLRAQLMADAAIRRPS